MGGFWWRVGCFDLSVFGGLLIWVDVVASWLLLAWIVVLGVVSGATLGISVVVRFCSVVDSVGADVCATGCVLF